MNSQQKWKFSTGKVVEDAMYTFGMKCTEEHLVHSFVLDTSDSIYLDHDISTEQELQEIKTCDKKPLTRLPNDLREYINSFSENDCRKLLQKVDTPWPWQANYDLSKNGDYDWVRNTVYGLVREYEADNFSHDHLEGWYNVHIWCLFDTVFDILKNVEQSISGKENYKRKFGALVPMKRKKIGHRCDSIIQRLTTNHEPIDEFGASEVAKDHDKFSTKILYEHGHKLPKMLRDMFNALCSSYPSIVRQLETVGYIHQGLSCRLLRLDSPDGYVARITHIPEEDCWLTLAAKVDRFKEQTLPVILLAWQAKEIVSRMLSIIADTEEDHASDSLWLDNVFSIKPTIVMPRCSTSMETQTKKKKTMNN
ncbi:unnamed protein product [Rhizopus stolonifer]